jgi:hypothetical protein
MKIRTWLLAALAVAWLWPARQVLAEGVSLAQIQALVAQSKQKNSGPFAGFAGIYDLLKSCRPLEHPDVLLGTSWLQTKWVVWFEGDSIVFVQFLAPTNVIRGTLKFKQDYSERGAGTVKLYDVTWERGSTEVMAFLPDRELFDIKLEGGKFSAKYTLRCRNDDQLLGWAGDILRVMGR